MKKIEKFAAQGDVIFLRVDVMPEGCTPIEDPVVAHSETGHHHTVHGDFQRYARPNDGLVSYMIARGNVEVRHHRVENRHEAFELLHDESRGETIWEIRRPRELSTKGIRRVED